MQKVNRLCQYKDQKIWISSEKLGPKSKQNGFHAKVHFFVIFLEFSFGRNLKIPTKIGASTVFFILNGKYFKTANSRPIANKSEF